MKKRIISQHELNGLVNKICRDILVSKWQPDYIVGITRGGLIPAVMISQYLNVPMYTLGVSLRDGSGGESNLWMAEDALGSRSDEKFIANEFDVGAVLEAASELLEQGDTFKNILIVDDINDTGATLDWIVKDWQDGCLPNDPRWADVWGNNVRFAVLFDNLSSKFSRKIDYSAVEINKAEEDVWIVYPWEH